MKNRFIVVLALVVLAFASVPAAAENLPQSEVDEIVKGVESGDAEAQFRLGMMYLNGQNVKQDYEQAFYWLKKSYEQGNVEAQYWVAIYYIEGRGVEKNVEQAFKLMKQVTEKDPDTIKNVHGFEKDGKKIYSSAEELIAMAQYLVGVSYYEGSGVQKDVEQAERWLEKSLEHGSELLKREAGGMLKKIRAKKMSDDDFIFIKLCKSYEPQSDKVLEAINNGANVNAQDDDGITALMYVLLRGYSTDVINAFIKAGADINAKDNFGGTPLMKAARSNNPKNIAPLIKAGAEVNVKNDWGYTALIWAAKEGMPESVNALLDAGAVVTIKDDEGKTALDYARENKNLTGTDALRRLENLSGASQTQTSQSKSESVMEIDFEQAFKECRNNGLVYKRKYEGKKVRVTEKIYAVDTLPPTDKIFVRLSYKKNQSGFDDFDDLYCFFEDSEENSVMKLKAGQIVTIEGTCTDSMLPVVLPFTLEKCRIVSTSQPTSQFSAPSAGTANTTAIAIDDDVKEFMQRENIPYSIAAKGDVYLLRSYTSQFKAVNGNTAYIYSEPDTSSMAVLKLDNGAKLIADAEYVGKDGSDWYYVHFGDSARGWVQSQYITDRDPDDDSSDNSSESSETNFSLSDAEYKQMMKNSDFAKADKALNNAWQNAKKSMNANSFNKLKQEQNEWISSGRDSWANSLSDYYDRAVAYAIVTETRANYISMRARGCSAAYVTGDKVNVRSKPNTKGRVLFQVSRYIHEEPERLIIDGNFSRDSKGDIWYKVLYVFSYTPDSGDWGYCETNGWINGRFISSTPLEEKDYDLLMSAYSD